MSGIHIEQRGHNTALYGDTQSASRPGRFVLEKRSRTHCTGRTQEMVRTL
jgi:hypothetical protein